MKNKNYKGRKIKKIFQWQEYLNWKKMSYSQKLNFKRACLFPLLVIFIYKFLNDFTYAILIIILIYYLVRLTNKNKLSKK